MASFLLLSWFPCRSAADTLKPQGEAGGGAVRAVDPMFENILLPLAVFLNPELSTPKSEPLPPTPHT